MVKSPPEQFIYMAEHAKGLNGQGYFFLSFLAWISKKNIHRLFDGDCANNNKISPKPGYKLRMGCVATVYFQR